MRSKRITILMPVYNGAKYLRETIDNVLLQTYRDFIFLIINDGSADETEKIILSYTDSRIRYEKNNLNLGLVSTLNKGIDLVETEFLARMDSDDLWVETKLEKQLQLFDSRPDVGICGTSIRKFGSYEADFYFPTDNAGLKVGFIFYCCMSHPSVVFRMSFLRESGLKYRADYLAAEDYKMWVECLEYTQIYNIPEKLVLYRQHDKQVTQNSNLAQIKSSNKIRLEIIEELSNDFTEKEKDFHLNNYIKSDILSNTHYKLFKQWTDKLLQLNGNKAFVFDAIILKQSLRKHVKDAYWRYVRKKYFHGPYIFTLYRYIISFDWLHVYIRNSMKLVLRIK